MLRLLATALTLFTVGSATCPEGTFTDAYGTGCFYVVVKRLPWSSAEKMCQVYGGHLASVADCDANSILKLTIPSSPRVEFWLGGKSNEGRWNWADGSEFNYSNWAEGEPSINHGRCVTQDQEGTWHARDCQKRKPFICRIPTLQDALSSTLPTLPSTFNIDLTKKNSCEDGWSYSDVTGKCYKLVTGVTFSQAVRTCLELDSKMLSIHNARENEWFTAFARPAVDKFFVGLVFNGIDDKWKWMDGSEADFLPWYVARGEPNNAGGREFCGEVKANYRPSNGLWNDVTCEAVRAVICEKNDS